MNCHLSPIFGVPPHAIAVPRVHFPEGTGTLEMLCIYEVHGAHIRKAFFAVGEKRLHAL